MDETIIANITATFFYKLDTIDKDFEASLLPDVPDNILF